MNDFTASNEYRVRLDDEGRLLSIRYHDGSIASHSAESAQQVDALQEFFRAKDDERLGRWRWPENPDFVVYPDGGDRVDVLYEPGGGSTAYDRADAALRVESDPQQAAVAYFDAHPEPKPWHEALDGETWVLTVNGVEDAYANRIREWERIGDGYILQKAPGSPAITAGRRIWPKEVS